MWDERERAEPDAETATWDDVVRYFAKLWGDRVNFVNDPKWIAERTAGMTEEQARARLESARAPAILQRDRWITRLMHDHYVPIEETSDAARSRRLRKEQGLLPGTRVIPRGET